MAHEYEARQEIRFAIVMYGGVSLAIYINGVAQEMLRLVRATALPYDELDEIEKVYHELGEALKARFCIDVISGTSAGGINGIFLAKALANQVKLDSLQTLWVQQGAIENLLNDKQSYKDIPVAQPRDTKSLLNGARMYYELLDAFEKMDGKDDPPPSPLVDRLSVFATTTDINGVALPIQLADMVVFERRYKNVFRFRYSKDGEGKTEVNHFAKDNNPILAFAARCTSSFPFAFEPMTLQAMDPVLEGFPRLKSNLSMYKSSAECWQDFFQQYVDPEQGRGEKNSNFVKRPFGDGGYLNNKPFSYAIDALADSESDLPVQRKLFYVEPSPDHPELERKEEIPNAIENSLDALITIPGYQTIREDLGRAMDRNALISRVREALRQIEADSITTEAEKCGKREVVEFLPFEEDACYQTYYRLRASDVTDQFATAIGRAYRIEGGTSLFRSIRALLHEWRVDTYGTEMAGIFKFLHDFDLPYRLRRLRFLLRKLDELQQPANGDSAEDKQKAEAFLRMNAASMDAATLGEMRKELAQKYRVLLALRRELLSDEIPVRGASAEASAPQQEGTRRPLDQIRDTLGPVKAVRDILQKVVPDEPATGNSPGDKESHYAPRRVMRSASDPKGTEDLYMQRAREALAGDPRLLQTLRDLGKKLAALMALVLEGTGVATLLASNKGMPLRPFYLCFDRFDSAAFLMLYGTNAAEGDTVDILRISPEDPQRLQPDVEERRTKLKGLAVAHFGAFLDESWRENDILWGRLDGAERMIEALLPLQGQETFRKDLIDRAQAAIIADFHVVDKTRDLAQACVAGKKPNVQLNRATEPAVIAAMTAPREGSIQEKNQRVMANWSALVSDEMDREKALKDAARATAITGRILDGIAADQSVPSGGRWLTLGGRILFGLVELAAPRTAWEGATRYWVQMLLLIAILLIAGGALSGQAPLTQFGWTMFGIVFGVELFWMALRSFMSGKKIQARFATVVAVITVVIVVSLLAAGAYQFWLLWPWAIAWVSAWASGRFGKDAGELVGSGLVNAAAACFAGVVLLGLERFTRGIDRGY